MAKRKGKKRGKTRRSAKQRAASRRNIKKAIAARRRSKRHKKGKRKGKRKGSKKRRSSGRLGVMQRLIKQGYSPERAYKIAERYQRMKSSAALRGHAAAEKLANAFAGFGVAGKLHGMAHG